MKELPHKFSEQLHNLPETGMDYQVISVKLRDGRTIEDVAIVGSKLIGEVRGHDDIPFEPDEIESIQLTHRKWEFKR